MSFIQIQNLAFSYGGLRVFENLSLEIEQGRFCGIAGPNGVGKSTLLELLAGHRKPSSGKIRIGGLSLGRGGFRRSISQMAAFVPQESTPVFGYTSYEIVMMARYFRSRRFFFEQEEDRKIVQEAMRQTFTEDLASRPITCLSGGERQRVYLARAIAQETPLLLLDEPLSHLDLKHQILIYEALKRLHLEQKTILMATHDLNLAVQYCDWMILMGPGGRLFSGPVQEILTEENIGNIYGIECRVYTVEGMHFFVPKAIEGEGKRAEY